MAGMGGLRLGAESGETAPNRVFPPEQCHYKVRSRRKARRKLRSSNAEFRMEPVGAERHRPSPTGERAGARESMSKWSRIIREDANDA
jgi:hypothetical protein